MLHFTYSHKSMFNIYKYVSIFFHRASKAYSRHIMLLGSKPLRETFPDKIKEWMKKQFCKIYSTGYDKVSFFMSMKYVLPFEASKLFVVLHGLVWFIAKSHFHGLPLCSPFVRYALKKKPILFGNFSQTSDPPPFWEPLIQKKNLVFILHFRT